MNAEPVPYAAAIGVERGEDGLLRLPFADHLLGRPAFLHGGAISGLLEIAAMAALLDALGEARPTIKPVNVTVDFLRGGRAELTYAKGSITRLGGRVANAEARAWQDDPEKPIAIAHLNYLLRRE